jgi:flagellar hook-basal body complex protein FliE/predicted transcriptional regulator
MCLHTCLHCGHAVISERYYGPSSKLEFDGCWKHDITIPVSREECESFEESTERITREFWEKWKWKVYVDGDLVIQKVPEETDEESLEKKENLPQNTENNHIIDYRDLPNIKKKNVTTRALVLQALANNISRLRDIAQFASVDPSTTHYHLRNLIREERVIKISWGEYSLADENHLQNDSLTFEKFLKNSSRSIGKNTNSMELHPVEKNILLDILSTENKYKLYSERELARKSKISRYAARKYTIDLEKKKLITIKRKGKQLIFTPTEVAINGLSEYFSSVKTGSKSDSSSSKVQPITQPVDSKVQPIVTNTLETFEDYLSWQQKNAHRLIIQFKLLRCNHQRLKKSGWIFGQKSIHKHFTQAYIFKSKDPSAQIINVLPKHPFIFTSEFEFQDQLISFVNELIDRLKDYGIIIDLSEPAEIKLQHEALENDAFARKAIKKGLLYFRSRVKQLDSTGEIMEYAVTIDKSKKIHLEFEGYEAHHLVQEYEEFIDDVITRRIDRRDLRNIPGAFERVDERIGGMENILQSSIQDIQDTQNMLHQNQLLFSENLVSHVDMVQKITKAAESLNRAAENINRALETFHDISFDE